MPGAVIEVKYFNSFVLKKTVSTAGANHEIAWNGSFGIPASVNGGYPTVVGSTDSNDDFILEEARIRLGYITVYTDYVPKIYLIKVASSCTKNINT